MMSALRPVYINFFAIWLSWSTLEWVLAGAPWLDLLAEPLGGAPWRV